MNILKLAKYIQAGNVASKKYADNAATDTYTVVGGVSLSATVAAVLVALRTIYGNAFPVSDELIATIVGGVGIAGSQIIPYITHWIESRRLKAEADAKLRMEESGKAELLEEELTKRAAAGPPVAVSIKLNDADPIIAWYRMGTRHSAITHGNAKSVDTVGEARAYGATSVVLPNNTIVNI